MKATELLESYEQKELLKFVVAGSVDDGKSTLIGRLLFESKGVYEDELAEIQIASNKTGLTQENLDLALITDGLKAEREQGITIDVAHRYFSTPRRKFIIADAPGHEQYTRNMVTGTSTANLIIILIDATKGLVIQSKRHIFIASLLAVRHVVVVVNKMDLVNYSRKIFNAIVKDFANFAAKLELSDVTFIPASALKGENIIRLSNKMAWYNGNTVLEHLETTYIASDRDFIDMRFPIQLILRPFPAFRGYLGTVASGTIRKGDNIIVLPSRKCSRVKSIFFAGEELDEAFPPLSIGIRLEDELDISRGDMLLHTQNVCRFGNTIAVMLMWTSEEPMKPGQMYIVKHTTKCTLGFICALHYRIDIDTLHRDKATCLKLNEIGRCAITLTQPVAYDPYIINRSTGSFIVIDKISYNTVGAGIILDRN